MAAFTNWRVRSTDTAVAGEYMGATELQFRETSGGANTLTGGTATASANAGAPYLPDKALDGNAGTFWTTGGVAPPSGGHWWAYAHAAPKDITEIVYTSRSDGVREDPLNLFIEYYDPASFSWVTRWSVTGIAAWTAGETRTFTAPAATANLQVTKQTAYAALLASSGLAVVAKQTAYAGMMAPVGSVHVAKQTAYAIMMTAEVKIAKQTAYVVMMPESDNRRMSLM